MIHSLAFLLLITTAVLQLVFRVQSFHTSAKPVSRSVPLVNSKLLSLVDRQPAICSTSAFRCSLSAKAKGDDGTTPKKRKKKISVEVEEEAIESSGSKASEVKVDDTKKAKEEQAPVPVVRKGEIITILAAKTGMSKVDSEAALSAVLDVITEEVASGKKVSLSGFGTFKLNYRAARKGRNPRTGEEIDIEASSSPGFLAAKGFKDKVNS